LLKSIPLLMAATAVFAADAGADTYPDRTIKIIVGLPPGGAPDTTARPLAEKLQAAWGKPVVVENVTGAAGNIAADRVAKSPSTVKWSIRSIGMAFLSPFAGIGRAPAFASGRTFRQWMSPIST
jgi:tripartite-type tricarboxylate transporter receptor subunit TctC